MRTAGSAPLRFAATLLLGLTAALAVGPSPFGSRVQAADQPTALLVVSQAAALTPDEVVLQDRLAGLGYAVEVRDGLSFAGYEGQGAAIVVFAPGADVAFGSISELEQVAVPIVSLNQPALMALGLAQEADLGTARRQRELNVKDSLHPLAAGFYGRLSLGASAQTLGTLRVAEPAKTVLEIPDDATQSLSVGFDTGEPTASGPAPARRVGLLLPAPFVAAASREAKDLFTAAVYWATERNAPPWVFAGSPQVGPVGEWVLLPGRASDDGLPGGKEPVLSQWTKVSGPGLVRMDEGSSTYTHAKFSKPGMYVMRLASSDGELQGSDTVTVTISTGASASSEQAAPALSESSPQGVSALISLGDVLLVVGNITLDAGDTAIKNRVLALGFTVTVVQGVSATNPSSSAATGKAGVIVSSSSPNTIDQFDAVSVPVLVVNEGICDNYHICDFANRGTVSGNSIVIASPQNPMAAGLSGTVVISTINANISGGGVTAAADKIAVMTTDATRAVVAGYDQGDLMYDGITAPNRRVLYGLQALLVANPTSEGAALFDQMILWLTRQNLKPIAKAGADFSELFPAATLAGQILDDGLPNPPGQITATWSFVGSTGAGTAIITNPTCTGTIAAPPSCLTTGVTFTSDGLFTLQLLASDGTLSSTDLIQVNVLLQNQAPVVNAGPDKVVVYPPGTLALSGSASDDGLPNPPSGMTFAWSKISGPGTVGFSPTNTLSTTATFGAVGVYIVRLTASDGALSGYDDVVVTAGGSALLVVNDSASLTAADNFVKTIIEGIGLTAVSLTAPGLTAAVAATQSAGRKFVIIGPTAGNADITTQFRTVTVPVIATKNGYEDDMSMAQTVNRGVTSAISSFTMVANNPPHPLSAGLTGSPGMTTQPTTVDWTVPEATGIKVATVPGSATQCIVYAYEKNVVMSGGFTSPERRIGVHIPFVDATFITPASRSLIDAAMRWAARINQKPIVDAGPPQTTTALTIGLDGTVSDDAQLNPLLTLQWSVDAPVGAAVTFTTPTLADTNVTVPGPGTYLFRLTAFDGELTSSDVVEITVMATGLVNQAPIASAGADQLVKLPQTAALHASFSDDGLPAPPHLTVTWSKISGPGAATFPPPDGSVEVTASETTTYRMFGLSNGNSDANYTDIDFGFYPAASGALWVYEAGTSRGQFGTYATNDKLQVAVESGVVKYKKNGTVVYTSTVAPTYPLLVDTALYTQGATLNAATLFGSWGTTTPPPAGTPVVWTSLVGVSANANSLTKTAATAWGNAGAVSSQTLTQASGTGVDVTPAFSLPGVYVMRLSVSDGLLVGTDEVRITVEATRQALLITNAATLVAEEAAAKSRLEATGFTVTVKTGSAAVSGDATGKAVVFVPASANSVAVNTKFKGTATPVVVAEQDLFDDMAMTGTVSGTDFGVSTSQTQITITTPTHPLAAGLSGTVVAYGLAGDMGWGLPGVNAVGIARDLLNPSHMTVFGFTKGQLMAQNFIAPGRRVGIFARPDNLTTAGWELFDAAIAWATVPEVPALFVVGASPPSAGSADWLALIRLQQLGFAVTSKLANASLVTADANGKALVVISSTANDANVTNKFTNSTVPALVWETSVFDDMKMTGTVSGTDFGTTASQTAIAIVDATHPLAAGFPVGSQTVTTSATHRWGVPSSFAARVATVVGNPNRWPLFGYEVGASMVGANAPDRRVGFFLDDNTATALTAGWSLFDAAVKWAVGSDADGDGLDIFTEFQVGTDPRDSDSNDNGIPDGQEKKLGLNPTTTDSDGDGVTNAQELLNGTDPFRADTDGDLAGDLNDCFPLDSTRWACLTPIPGDVTPPAITLLEPAASLLSAVCTPSPCPL